MGAFDLAFCLTHLFLKSLLFEAAECLMLARSLWNSYFEELGNVSGRVEMQPRIGRLLLMLIMARIDGKSPVEYLVGKENQRAFIRSLVTDLLLKNHFDFDFICQEWNLRLQNANF